MSKIPNNVLFYSELSHDVTDGNSIEKETMKAQRMEPSIYLLSEQGGNDDLSVPDLILCLNDQKILSQIFYFIQGVSSFNESQIIFPSVVI